MSNGEQAASRPDPLRTKTKSLALQVIQAIDELPSRDMAAQVMTRQLLRSATSVGANYRAATRARSPREMYAKLAIVEEEADEAMYWLDLLAESGRASIDRLKRINDCANEVVAMVVKSKQTLSARIDRGPLATRKRSANHSTLDTRHSSFGDGDSEAAR